MKNKILYKIGLLSGLIPLIGGLFIFFTWWIARAFFTYALNSFEDYGFFWMLISVPVASIGILLLIIFAFKNYPNFLIQSLFGILLILINIPTLDWVLDKQTEIDKRTYIKIYNKSNEDNIELTLKASYFEKKLGKLNEAENSNSFYYPKYTELTDDSSVPTIESVTLIVKTKFTTRYLTLPSLDSGECQKLYLDKEFNLLTHWKQK